MEKKGVVSLWIGNTKSNKFLNNYMEMKYTEEGEWEPSEFLNDFNIDMDDVEEDFIEKVRYEEVSDDLERLLSGCSYEDVVIPNIKKNVGNIGKKNINTVILVYDLEYSGDKVIVNNGTYSMEYVCTVEYQ